MEQLGLESPIVTVNGSEVWQAPHRLHQRHLLDPAIISELHRLARYYDTRYMAYSVGKISSNEQWVEDIYAEKWLKFGYQTENHQHRQEIINTLRGWESLEITSSNPLNIEINPIGVHKGAGVQAVCGLLGITMSQVVAIGDSLNDINMIRKAGLGIAMGNAQDEVKRAADKVTATNKEDGVAAAIRDYILSEG
jgi:hydroxymethylpyrimidine pyrophosphatase-like HAD family hydrolase